jgi:hypothetical protein
MVRCEMSIDKQAQETFNVWKERIVREGGAFWKHGNLTDEDEDAWLRGYFLGVEHRLEGRHDADSSDQRLWDYGEDMEYFSSDIIPSEMMGKCHAAGYTAGYRLTKWS